MNTLLSLFFGLLAQIEAADTRSPINIGSRRELFVDDALVERLGGKADFRLQHPTPRELSLYATEGNWRDEGTALRRYTLRLDGFVSIHAPMSGGELVTKPIRFSGNSLSLNFATSVAGDIRIELQDAAGKPLSGYALADCDELFGDTVDRVATWKGSSNLSTIADQTIRLRFVPRDADLFSFQFGDE